MDANNVEPKRGQVFISHAHQDEPFAKRLVADLKKCGWQVWTFEDDIQSGQDFVSEINRGLAKSKVFVLVATPLALTSHWVNKELNAALALEEEGLRLFIAEREKCDYKDRPLLKPIQRTSFVDDYESGLKALLAGLDGRQPIPPASPKPSEPKTKHSNKEESGLPESPKLSKTTPGHSTTREDTKSRRRFLANRFLVICGGSGVNLLGQLEILGFSAELQIDASAEILDTKGENRRFALKLDAQIGSMASALLETKQLVSDQTDAASSTYLQQKITDPADIKHTQFLVENWPGGGNLKDGLAQSPAIGGATIKHPHNAEKLRNILVQMIMQFCTSPGPENPLEFWVVSSTAGGTGEGTHRFVGAVIADVVQSLYYLTPVTVNFARIGCLTYRSVNPMKTVFHTFLGIAADAALEREFKRDYPNAIVNWFFMDLPDVGKDDAGKRTRSEMIEMATKAIMLPDLSEGIGELLRNDSGSRTVVVRAGFWGRDFGDNVKYFETLKQLLTKLDNLIKPQEALFLAGDQPQPYFDEGEWGKRWADPVQHNLENPSYLRARIEDGWQFPRYQDTDLLDADRRNKWIGLWKSAIIALIGTDIDEFQTLLMIKRVIETDGRKQYVAAPFDLNVETGTKVMFAKIEDAYRAKAWSSKLLGMGTNSVQGQGLLNELHRLALSCSQAMYPPVWGMRPINKARQLSKWLWRFVITLVKVNALIKLDIDAGRTLDFQLSSPKVIREFAQKEFSAIRNFMWREESMLLQTTDLSQTLDRMEGKSWIQLLDEAVQQGDRNKFRVEVLKGATGLTFAGLCYILSLPQNADVVLIRNTLNERMGRMITQDGQQYEAQWWQAASPHGATMQSEYRILPELESGLEEELRAFSEYAGGPAYVFTNSGTFGLRVLALEAISLNTYPPPDTTTVFTYLLRPVVQIVQDTLVGRSGFGTKVGKFEIASAGVIGEPLDKRVLRNAGLSNEAIDRLGEFYQFSE